MSILDLNLIKPLNSGVLYKYAVCLADRRLLVGRHAHHVTQLLIYDCMLLGVC